ncbi:Mediator of DNA damage checkpoint protein 1, partial [Frankliniella fusca]
GVIATSVDSADVLVTDKFRRTVKLLCFLGKGLPIVGPQWLLHSKAAMHLVDPWEHILSDKESETKFNTNLRDSLIKSGKNPILKGFHIYITKNVKPQPDEIKAIVSSSGGVVVSRAPSVWPSNSVAISCPEDKAMWTKLKNKIPVVSTEWLLQGVLQQNLKMEDHILK